MALLELKDHITSDPYSILAKNWSISSSVCNWIGVTCSYTHHHRVRALNISNMGLAGSIPSNLGNLSFLVSLDMGDNSFHGHLPEGMAHLRRIRFISLSHNNFTGEIPSWFGFLEKLQHLSLRNNSFTGFLPPPLFNISGLGVIDFSENNLSGIIPVDMCNNLPSLKRLLVSSNKLNGQILSGISKCWRLEVLSLSNNEFSGRIPREVGNLQMLEELYLGGNNLGGEIPKEIGNLTMIQNLYLYENNLTGFIPQEMGKLSKLESLDLELNRLGGPIPAWIFNISTIQFLSLSANSFFGSLPPNMCHVLKNLQGLYLAGNYLSGNIPMSISNCSRLTIITLLSNEFTGSIPDSLGNLRQLNVLQLSDNKLTSESSSQELSLFSSLANCMLLRHISLERNPLNGVLPNSLGNLSSSIEIIYAFGSGIMGSIPGSIGNLSNLIALRLDNNQLTGSIPTSVKGLGKLQGLYLHNNIITGTLSTDLCNLRMLNDFNISQNQVSGSIPGCLGNITSIRYIDLSFNKITSSVPISLWNLKDLLELRLTSNFFNGSLAPEIGKLKAVTWLDMSLNHFSGNIPSTIGDLQRLIQLSLANNNLEGSIPSTIADIQSLEYLDLSHNNVSGSIPKLMENLTYLTYLNVSSNDLRGEIPSEGPFTKFTYDSFAFNRALCGAPRFHLPPCQTISRRKSRTRKTVLIAIILPGMLSVVIVAGLGTVFHRYKKKSKIPSQTGLSSLIEQPRISYYELLQATNGYSQENLLGVGSFGSVYKGILNDGKILAVKVFNLQLERAFRSFDAECNILRNLRHRNLTKVITSCSNPDFKSLVLEFMPNGSLEKWLHSENCSLDVMQRLNIMIDVACALQYLHHGYTTPVIHCDLKPSNVLLDQDMVAHVSDFGIAKMLSEEETITHTNTLATLGYIAPEYGSEGLVSTKCDVYSYGIMLMEMLTRKRPNDEMFDGNLSLRGWVCGSIANAIMDILDVNLIRSNEEYATQELECLSSIMKVALNCSKESPNERSNMEYALAALNHIKLHLLSCYRRP
nr:receptor kinase-like protein Xa21 isoform X1 [Coffea arabica]